MLFIFAGKVGAQTVTFGAAGDFEIGSNFQATVNQVAAHNPAFMMALGDFSYTSGAEQEWCNTWKASYNNVLLITGNHETGEHGGGNINNYVQYCPFTLSGLNGTYGHNYYFDYPNTNPLVRVIAIRAGILGSGQISYEPGSTGYNFVVNAIDQARSQGIKWIVIAMHKNYITVGQKPNELGSNLIPMLLDKKVDVILQGHEHNYQRSKFLAQNPSTCPKLATGTYDSDCVVDSDNSFVKGQGTIIGIIGTGGITLRSINTSDSEHPYFATTNGDTHGFGKFTLTNNQLSYQFVRSAGGNFTDSFTISEPVQTNTPAPTATPAPLPGDANGDGKVDGLDYVRWLNNYNRTTTAGASAGDFNGDGEVDGLDYVRWLNNYGRTGGPTTNPTASATSTPTQAPTSTPSGTYPRTLHRTSGDSRITLLETQARQGNTVYVKAEVDPSVSVVNVVWYVNGAWTKQDNGSGVSLNLPSNPSTLRAVVYYNTNQNFIEASTSYSY